MAYETILFETTNGVAHLTFNRPNVRNAINMKMIDEVEQVIRTIESSDDIEILLISGAGQAFCAGADTTEFLTMTVDENQLFLDRFANMINGIHELPIPVIGVINGFAFGGGAELATACDFRIASNQASFRFPGVSYGLVVSSWILPAIVGVPKAKELLFRSCIIPADEALRIGLADQLVESEELYSTAETIAKEIQSNSTMAVKKVKETLNAGIGLTVEDRLQLEKKANAFLLENTDYRETFSAFVEKRKSSRSK